MSDSETPDATPNDTPDPTASGIPSDTPDAAVPQDAPQALEAPSSGEDRLEAARPALVKPALLSPKRLWAAVAVLCVAAGTAASVLGAHALAHNDAADARAAFPRTSGEIAATLKQDIQHEEDLLVGAGTFF